MDSLIQKETIHFIFLNNEEYNYQLILIKKEIYESMTQGNIAYLYNNKVLIDLDKVFFESYTLKSLTLGIENIHFYSSEKSSILSLTTDKSLDNNFILSFKNVELDLTFKYNVIDKSGECGLDLFPDIINGQFSCMKCEFYNPYFIFLYIQFPKIL